ARALWDESLRAMLFAGAPIGRGGSAVRDDQYIPDCVRRNHLGYSRVEAVHVDRGDEGHRLSDVRQGVQRLDRGFGSARDVERYDGGKSIGVRKDAEGE